MAYLSIMEPPRSEQKAEAIFRRHRGVLRTSHAIELGIHPRTLYRLRDSGRLALVTRGVYRLADLPEPSRPDLLVVAARIPNAVVCLISALLFHGLTTQISREVQIALRRGARHPRLSHPPIRVVRLSGRAFNEGIEVHLIEGVHLRVYNPAKTVADCFKFRNKIGLDVALEALRDFRRKHRGGMDDLWRFAKVCRVTAVMRPYLEALA